MKPTYRKSWAGIPLMWSDLTLGPLFKVKQGYPNLNVLITCLVLVLDVCNVKPSYKELMGWESFNVVRFDLGPLLQGPSRIAKLKSAYDLLIIVPRGLQYVSPTYRKSWAGNLLMGSYLT